MQKKVLILGGTGMLGHTLFTQLSAQKNLDVYATARTSSSLSLWFSPDLVKRIRLGIANCNLHSDLKARVRKRAEAFSWEKCAKVVYRALVDW